MGELQETDNVSSADPRQKRPEFLIEVYKQMMADINRHLIVVWQSIGVVVGSFALMGLVEKNVVTLDIATTLTLAVCLWSLLLLIDSGYWYNRNLCIVANIEKLFLAKDDLKNVHYYFGEHREHNRMITTIRIQYRFAMVVAALVLAYHFWDRVLMANWPTFTGHDWLRIAPYAFAGFGWFEVLKMRKSRDKAYEEFIYNSPGIPIDTSNIMYGPGHGAMNRST